MRQRDGNTVDGNNKQRINARIPCTNPEHAGVLDALDEERKQSSVHMAYAEMIGAELQARRLEVNYLQLRASHDLGVPVARVIDAAERWFKGLDLDQHEDFTNDEHRLIDAILAYQQSPMQPAEPPAETVQKRVVLSPTLALLAQLADDRAREVEKWKRTSGSTLSQDRIARVSEAVATAQRDVLRSVLKHLKAVAAGNVPPDIKHDGG